MHPVESQWLLSIRSHVEPFVLRPWGIISIHFVLRVKAILELGDTIELTNWIDQTYCDLGSIEEEKTWWRPIHKLLFHLHNPLKHVSDNIVGEN